MADTSTLRSWLGLSGDQPLPGVVSGESFVPTFVDRVPEESFALIFSL